MDRTINNEAATYERTQAPPRASARSAKSTKEQIGRARSAQPDTRSRSILPLAQRSTKVVGIAGLGERASPVAAQGLCTPPLEALCGSTVWGDQHYVETRLGKSIGGCVSMLSLHLEMVPGFWGFR